MAAPLELSGVLPLQQQRSLQSSLLFMQEEHAKTLKALHSEIQHLQKKCSELTFSLAMGITSSPQEDFYREKCEAVQAELETAQGQLGEARAAAEGKEKRVSSLEQQLRAQEKKYQDLTKNKERQVRQLKAELAEKAQENASLMYRHLATSHDSGLYRVLAPDTPLAASVPATAVRGASPSPRASVPMTPHPPREGGSARRRRSPRLADADTDRAASPARPGGAGPAKPSTPLGAGRLSGRGLRRAGSQDAAVPDPAFFLEPREEPATPQLTSTARYNPLPPIHAAPGGGSARGAARRHRGADEQHPPALRQHQHSRVFIPKHKSIQKHKSAAAKADHSSGSSSPEVEILAVDTVIKRNHKMRRAQEFNN